jgi:hypothetical protein
MIGVVGCHSGVALTGVARLLVRATGVSSDDDGEITGSDGELNSGAKFLQVPCTVILRRRER